jgi:single-strand DNA-binding protein
MSDLNKCCLVGRLSRDSLFKVSSSGTSLCDFSIAVNRSRKKEGGEWEEVPHFFNLRLFGARADGMHDYLVKGQTVSIEGHLETLSYERDGYKNTRMILSVDDIRLIGPRKKAGEPARAEKDDAAGESPDGGDDSVESDETFTDPPDADFPELTDEDLNLEGLEGEPNI